MKTERLTDFIYSFTDWGSIFFFQDKQLNHNTADGVILTNRSLVLQGIDRTRSGGYTCQALNAVGSGQSQVIELDVKCKTLKLSNWLALYKDICKTQVPIFQFLESHFM